MIPSHAIELRSGKYLNLAAPRPDAITVFDVAGGLSNLCRFTGQSLEFYSVAEHAVLVSRRLEELGCSREVCLAGLHHDDAEAFAGDVSRPLKSMLTEYKAIERRVLRACSRAIGFDYDLTRSREVKDADNWALAQEAAVLLPSVGREWPTAVSGIKYLDLGLSPARAHRAFLFRHWALGGS